jgi:WhiB family redox-sensing transcriptional regulator
MTRQSDYEIVADTSWMQHAACEGADPDLFFPEQGGVDVTDDARQMCARCPVRGACLEFAITTHQDHGVWGGKSARERARIRRQRRRASA